MEADGPRKNHRSVRDIDKATHTLHIDIAGPFTTSDDGYSYFLVGALRLPGLPLLIDVRTLSTRGAVEVCDELEKMVSYLESLQCEGLPIARLLERHLGSRDSTAIVLVNLPLHFSHDSWAITRAFTTPLPLGTILRPMERRNGQLDLLKCLSARALATSHLDVSYWSYAVRYAAQSLLCNSLQLRQKSLPFGCPVVAQILNRKDVRFPESRTITGRLLFWDHLHDQVSYILFPPDGENIDSFVYRAGLPARFPPVVDIDDLTGRNSLPINFR